MESSSDETWRRHMLTQSKAAQRAAGDPWSATALRAHLEGLWTPKPQGFSSATELGRSWDAALAAAKLQGSHRARDASHPGTEGLLISVGTLKGVTATTADLFSTCQSRALLKLEVFSTWSRIREIFRSINTWSLLLCSKSGWDEDKTSLWSWKQSQNRYLDAQSGQHHSTSSLMLFAKASAVPASAVSNIQCFVHFKLSAGWWKLTKHDGAKRKSAPPLIATRVHQICHEQWHARHNKHLWSQTPRFSLPQNRGCWWQMGRVKQADRPKSCSCISLPRPEPRFIAETTNFLAPDRKKKIYKKLMV